MKTAITVPVPAIGSPDIVLNGSCLATIKKILEKYIHNLSRCPVRNNFLAVWQFPLKILAKLIIARTGQSGKDR
jgi:hypothetical protein